MNRASRLTPIRSPGTITGSVTRIRAAPRKRNRERTSGKAAAVPTIVLTTVTCAAITSEVTSASWMAALPNMSPYQRVVQPVIGKPAKRLALKLNRINSAIGANRKA